MRKKLTPKTVEHLPPADGKRYEVRDTIVVGLVLRVSNSGGKVWCVTARVADRQRRIKIGTYPILSLADARQKAREVLRDIQLGRYDAIDAADEDLAPTLGEIIPQFISLYAQPRNRDWRRTERTLAKFSQLNEVPLNEIKRQDIVRVLDTMIANGTPFRANRALAAIKKLFAWSIDRGTIEINPIASLKPPTKERPRDRVLTSEELIACWRAAEAENYPFGPCIKMLVLTGQRRSEVSGMRWSEIDFDRAEWTLPAERTKNATKHVVPLVPFAIDIVRGVPRFLGSDLVFTTTGRSSISGFGRLKARLDDEIGALDWRLHDIRRTVATQMAMLGVAPHIIEAVLNHKTGIVSGVSAVYNRHAYSDEKRDALQRWSNYVERAICEAHALVSSVSARPMGWAANNYS